MFFIVREELRDLAELFYKKKSRLYIVGGFVRNKILGVPDYKNLDIDLCSKSTPEEVKEILKGTEFEILNIDNSFGVIKIKYKNNIYEHATFRTEVYDFAGAHNPSNVEFIDNLEIDSLRRDFKCNSVYYDIYNAEIVDPLGGISDIRNGLISTTRSPEIVFNDDSERIMRMVRQAVSLGFNIEEKTYETAKNNVFKLKYLSKTRLRREFDRILFANMEYDMLQNSNIGHARGILLLADLGILNFLLPQLYKIYNLPIVEDRGRNLFNHIIETFRLCEDKSLETRLALLVHDYGKAEALIKNNNFFGYEELSSSLIEQELGDIGLGYNKKVVSIVKKLVSLLSFKINMFTSNYKIRKFIFNNYLYINNFINIKKYISINKYNNLDFETKKLIICLNNFEKGNYPKSVSDLNIKANDIIENYSNIKKEKISEILDKLVYKCLKSRNKNNRQSLLKEVKNIVNKNKFVYLEEV